MSDYIHSIIRNFSSHQLSNFIRLKATHFRPVHDILNAFLKRDENFDRAEQIGVIEFSNAQTVIVATIHVADTLTARSSKRKQYEMAKRILKADNHNAGILLSTMMMGASASPWLLSPTTAQNGNLAHSDGILSSLIPISPIKLLSNN